MLSLSGLDHARHTCFLRCCFRVGTVHASCNHKDVLGVVLHGVLKLVVLAHACKQGLSIPAQFILLLLQDRLPHACALRCVRWICEGVLGVWGVLGDFGTPLHFLCNMSLTPDHVWVSLSRKVGKQADFCCPAACQSRPLFIPKLRFLLRFDCVSMWAESPHWYKQGLVVGCRDWSGHAHWCYGVTIHAACVLRHAWA